MSTANPYETIQEQKETQEKLEWMTQHKGHEKMHHDMALILIFTLMASQLAIYLWKRTHPSSFNWTSLIGLWAVPPLIALKSGNHRFLCFWVFFSCANYFIVKAAFAKPLLHSTPANVYRWFATSYSISYVGKLMTARFFMKYLS